MKLIEAQKRIEKLAYIPFKEYLTEEQFNLNYSRLCRESG